MATEEELLTVTLDEALRLFAEPKLRGRAAPKPPLAELGPDPVTNRPMVIKDGKFGPYVTDGESNASLRVGDDPTTLSPERGAELLQARREAVANGTVGTKKAAAKKPAKKASARKSPAKKAGAKKAGAKRSTKKAAAGDGVSGTVRRTVAKGTSTRSKAGAKKATVVRSSAQRVTGIPGQPD